MAEFTKVMQQAQRMCASFRKCSECPMDVYPRGCALATVCGSRIIEDFEETERIVIKWADEHPASTEKSE